MKKMKSNESKMKAKKNNFYIDSNFYFSNIRIFLCYLKTLNYFPFLNRTKLLGKMPHFEK